MNTNEIKLTKLEQQVRDAYNSGNTAAWSIARSLSQPGKKITTPRVNQIQFIIDGLAAVGAIA